MAVPTLLVDRPLVSQLARRRSNPEMLKDTRNSSPLDWGRHSPSLHHPAGNVLHQSDFPPGAMHVKMLSGCAVRTLGAFSLNLCHNNMAESPCNGTRSKCSTAIQLDSF